MQIVKGKRMGKPVRPRRTKALEGCPQKSGVVISVLVKDPKKPSSANRACVKVRLSNGRVVYAFIPGEGHNLQPHSHVLVRGGRRNDLIGVNLSVVRGALDCKGVVGRCTSRSKYGTSRGI